MLPVAIFFAAGLGRPDPVNPHVAQGTELEKQY
jgi:hypothetical protein